MGAPPIGLGHDCTNGTQVGDCGMQEIVTHGVAMCCLSSRCKVDLSNEQSGRHFARYFASLFRRWAHFDVIGRRSDRSNDL
jgi:hypothetical protein